MLTYSYLQIIFIRMIAYNASHQAILKGTLTL